jgi:Rod binding domain-containing protein
MSPISMNTSAAPSKTDPKKIADAASQFEGFLLTEMLKSVHESGSGDWMGSSGDESGSSLSEMAQEQFAQALAASGGLGFAKMVTAQLAGNRQPRSAPLLVK